MLVQIYGITTVEDAAAVNALRPDTVGVVLDEGYGTWDSVDAPTLAAIRRELTDVRVVALSLSTDHDEILRTAKQADPAIVHVVRLTDAWSPAEVDRLRRALGPVELMLTVPMRDQTAVDTARRYADAADYLLLDTASSATGVVGATGEVHDWTLSRAIVEAVDVPVILAGGLGPDNVVEAIEAVGPAGVDSETHTSHPHARRRKDLPKVARFITLARSSA